MFRRLYLLSFLLFALFCSEKSEKPFLGLFHVQIDETRWKAMDIPHEKPKENPVQFIYNLLEDEGYYINIAVYPKEGFMDTDWENFFENINRSLKSDGKTLVRSAIKEVNGIHYQSTIYSQKNETERAGFTGHYSGKNYIYIFNMFYNRHSSNGKIPYDHNAMMVEFENLLVSFH